MAIISKHSKSGRIRVSKEIEQQLAAAAPAAEAGDVPPFRPGQKVRHPQFGEGLVLEASGSGQGATVKVAFPEAGCKSLALAYVKLEVVDE
jgi:DNA helicase-2/ATP-dependent DNA helicase PcrA